MKTGSLGRTKVPTPSAAPAPGRLLQRKCACGSTPGVTGECAECQNRRLNLQRKSAESQPRLSAPPLVHEVLRSQGQPLDSETLSAMESRFGHDFSAVRLHTDARASSSAGAIGALAYASGRDIVFAMGTYSPRTSSGLELLSHELVHVLQQRSLPAPSGGPLRISLPEDQHEHEADRVARNLVPLPREIGTVVQPQIQRQATESGASKDKDGGFIKCYSKILDGSWGHYDEIKKKYKNFPFSESTYKSINDSLEAYLGEKIFVDCDCCGEIISVMIRDPLMRTYKPNAGPRSDDDDPGVYFLGEQEVQVRGGSYVIDIELGVTFAPGACCSPIALAKG
jgi:uncharacterized protein DUF4157